MQRRYFTHLLAAVALALPVAAMAQAQEAEAPVLAAPKILEALSAKDIVLDRPGQPPRPGQPARREAVISLQVQFTFDSAELMPQGKRQLDQLAMALNNKVLLKSGFQLGGHTDRVGDADYNIKLSLARAEAVKAYLAEVHGVSATRLQSIGYGFSRLADPAHPTAAVNRRVEVRRVAAMPNAPAPSTQTTGGRLVPTPK